MHEMSVTQYILNLALEHAKGQKVTDIYLEVGRMSAVVPDSVAVFFRYLSENTLAEGAKLHFRMTPVEMTCQDCNTLADLSEWEDLKPHIIMGMALARGCTACKSKNLRVTGGVEFDMVSIDVE
jgi:hydrogenase nickel incorporation protein HypA/HybF